MNSCKICGKGQMTKARTKMFLAGPVNDRYCENSRKTDAVVNCIGLKIKGFACVWVSRLGFMLIALPLYSIAQYCRKHSYLFVMVSSDYCDDCILNSFCENAISFRG